VLESPIILSDQGGAGQEWASRFVAERRADGIAQGRRAGGEGSPRPGLWGGLVNPSATLPLSPDDDRQHATAHNRRFISEKTYRFAGCSRHVVDGIRVQREQAGRSRSNRRLVQGPRGRTHRSPGEMQVESRRAGRHAKLRERQPSRVVFHLEREGQHPGQAIDG